MGDAAAEAAEEAEESEVTAVEEENKINPDETGNRPTRLGRSDRKTGQP